MHRFTVRMPEDLYRTMMATARDQGISAAELVRNLLEKDQKSQKSQKSQNTDQDQTFTTRYGDVHVPGHIISEARNIFGTSSEIFLQDKLPEWDGRSLRGGKIGAIIYLRAHTSLGLVEAKDIVDTF